MYESPKGPNQKETLSLEELNLAWTVEHFNLAWKIKSWPSELPTKKGLVGGSLEIFILAWKFQSWREILRVFNLWAVRVLLLPRFLPLPEKSRAQVFLAIQSLRERPRGVENLGGEPYRKTPPQKRLWTPPHTIRVPPPPLFGDSLSFPSKGRGTDQTNPNSEASKSGFGEHALQYVSLPPNSRDTFCPPQRLPKSR